ncbi:Hypothetical predicted protein [Mytilus galloprovincialis]|uniref:Uncharacterized protein n=1 Tax=Mytilus galloprovincialis TaxID=29158 RepID=A0A8B6BUW7_MYTGA|nr:Hypothetical predicted protein [Mytilus galloprovincialis]
MLRVLLSIEIRNSSGIEIESFINSASSVIADKASYKFRVVGEAKIIAIFEVYDDTVVNTVTADIMRMGPYNVTCTPLIGIERLAYILGLNYQRDIPSTSRLSQKYVAWSELPMDNHGKVEF